MTYSSWSLCCCTFLKLNEHRNSTMYMVTCLLSLLNQLMMGISLFQLNLSYLVTISVSQSSCCFQKFKTAPPLCCQWNRCNSLPNPFCSCSHQRPQVPPKRQTKSIRVTKNCSSSNGHLEAGSKSESVPTKLYVQISNFCRNKHVYRLEQKLVWGDDLLNEFGEILNYVLA